MNKLKGEKTNYDYLNFSGIIIQMSQYTVGTKNQKLYKHIIYKRAYSLTFSYTGKETNVNLAQHILPKKNNEILFSRVFLL